MLTVDIEKVRKLRLEPARDGDANGADRRRGGSRGWVLFVFLLLGLGAAFVRWGPFSPVPKPGTSPVGPATATNTPPASDRNRAAPPPPGDFTAAGYVEPIPPFPVRVTPLLAGRIEEFAPVEGSPVRAGEVIARLERTAWERQLAELSAAVEVNREQLLQGERTLRRIERLAGSGSSSTDELEKARSGAAVLRAEGKRLAEELKTAAWRIENTVVRAPVSGVIFERTAHVGEFISLDGEGREATTIATIYDPEKVQVWVDVNQRDAARLAVGQPVEVSLDAEPGKTYRGRVLRVLPRASLSKNTVQAKIGLDEPSASLRPDMSVKVTFLPAAPGNPPAAARR